VSVSQFSSCVYWSSRAGEVLVCSETGRRWRDDLAVYMWFWRLVCLTQGVQCRLTSELHELRESRCLWMTNFQCLSVSFHLSCGLHLSGLFLPASNIFISPLCMFLSFSLSSFLCLTQQTGMFYTSYVSTSYNWKFYNLEYLLRGIDSYSLTFLSLSHSPSPHLIFFMSIYTYSV